MDSISIKIHLNVMLLCIRTTIKNKVMKTIFDYAKLNLEEKKKVLSNEATLLERYQYKEDTIYIYHLNGFFVELIIRNGIVTDNIPYKRGFRFDKKNIHAIQKRNILYSLAA